MSDAIVQTSPQRQPQARQVLSWAGWLTLFWLLLMHGAQAQVHPLETLPTEPLGRWMNILIESGPPLSIKEALQQQRQGAFQPGDSDVAKFGIAAKPVWLHLAVGNNQALPAKRRLEIEISWLDRIELYQVHGNQLVAQSIAGDANTAHRSPLAGLGYVFDLTLPPGRSDIFLRVATPDPLVVPVRLLDTAQAEALQLQYDYGYGVLYGFLLALIAYNAMLFIGLRERSYLDYTLYLGSFVLLHLGYTGHAYVWLWPQQTAFQQYAIPLLMVIFSCFGLRFASGFLNLRQHAPVARRLVHWQVTLGLILIFSTVAMQRQQDTVLVAFLFVLLFSVVMVWLGIITIRHGRIAGRYFLAAALTTMLGTSVTALAVWHGLPYTSISFHAAGWGVVIEGILLALALAYRMRQHQQARQQAEQLASTDPLTGLLNRRAFFEHAGPVWSTALRSNRHLSVLMADIDHFKEINDGYGHAMGDKVLAEISRLLAAACRSGDIAARWGGEEFVLLLPETDAAQACQLAERLRGEIECLKFGSAGQGFRLSASFGIAQLGDHESLDKLIHDADAWLYRAKQTGRNRVASNWQPSHA
ncbi:diguanylate cyclase [Dechloromonas denitrificans]|uniref:diguanylate cyclase n=1 Tax=Dechloromonas denitrificans TaxID=281362 RepID=UPI001CFB4C3F|nr:diguanylate cyclase [Dechloromonas denitrificans]UCV09622.1 GGDEF domain-containing protein [Dechloromonas denitrificans]